MEIFRRTNVVALTTTNIDECKEDKKCTDKQICVYKSILISCFIKNAILTHQKPTLLFYYIILQYLIYWMFYPLIIYIKIIFTTY